MSLVVADARVVADGVRSLRLVHPSGCRLPDWAPGAHIDLHLPGGLTRQYSLCGDRWDPVGYEIAVRREATGQVAPATSTTRSPPGRRRHRRAAEHLHPGPGAGALFIAGGIGITALLPMVEQVGRAGTPWRLLYAGRTRSSMAFTRELARWGTAVQLFPRDEGPRLDVAAVIAATSPGTKVYCCGPALLLAAVTAACADRRPGGLRIERFAVAEQPPPVRDTAYEVELRQSGTVLVLHPGAACWTHWSVPGPRSWRRAGKGSAGPARPPSCREPPTTGTPSSTAPPPTATGASTRACPGPPRTGSSSTSRTPAGAPSMTVPADVPPTRPAPDRRPVRRRRAGRTGGLPPAAARRRPGRAPGCARGPGPGAPRRGACRAGQLAGLRVRGRGGADHPAEEPPYRPPGVLLEMDPPDHDAPRHVVEPLLTPRVLHRLRERWDRACGAPGRRAVAAGRGRRGRRPRRGLPAERLPDAVGIPAEGRAHLLPYADHLFNTSAPTTDSSRRRRTGSPTTCLDAAAGLPRAADPDGFGAGVWAAVDRGDVTRRPGAGHRAGAARGGHRHHRPRPGRVVDGFLRFPDQWDLLRSERGRARSPSTRPSAGRHRCRPSSRSRPTTSASVTTSSRRVAGPHVPGVGQPGPAAVGRPGHLRPAARPGRARGLSAGASTGAWASTSPGWRPSACSPPWPPGWPGGNGPGHRGVTSTTPCAHGRAPPCVCIPPETWHSRAPGCSRHARLGVRWTSDRGVGAAQRVRLAGVRREQPRESLVSVKTSAVPAASHARSPAPPASLRVASATREHRGRQPAPSRAGAPRPARRNCDGELFSEERSAEVVAASFAGTPDPRFAFAAW